MKKSRIILLLAVVALVLLSGTTAFAAEYSGNFGIGYVTGQSVSISENGYIHLNTNDLAQFWYSPDYMWYDGAHFKTTARRNGVNFSSPYDTTGGSEHYFYWTGDPGTGTLRFDNDYYPYTLYTLRNHGYFY